MTERRQNADKESKAPDEWQVAGTATELRKRKKAATSDEQQHGSWGRRGGVAWAQSVEHRRASPHTAAQIVPVHNTRGKAQSCGENNTDSRYSHRDFTKFLCRFPIGIPADVQGGFRVARRLFGAGGVNMKRIASESGAKLRLRGQGSGFLEGPERKELDEPLVLSVSVEDRTGYRKAIELITELLEDVYCMYREHCMRQRLSQSQVSVRIEEHPANPR